MIKTIDKRDFAEIRLWVHRNARPLELMLWRFHFENGSADDVLAALSCYQNADGGMGNAIEPDNWNPESMPYATDFAINILRQIGFLDVQHPIYQGMLRFLKDTQYQSCDGWFFTVPGNDNYPHAVCWGYADDAGSIKQRIGITANLSGFILRYLKPDDEMYQVALQYVDMLLDKLNLDDDDRGDMGLGGYISLYQDLTAAGLGHRFDLDYLESRTRALVAAQFHEYVWSNHQDMAGAFPTPAMYYYHGYEQQVSDALDELIDIRPAGGVWPIPWQWYDGGAYSGEFAISENWWKSYKAIEKLLFIKAHGRLQID